MTEDHIWLRQQHDRLAEEFQRSRLSFAEAQEYRQEIASVWNDACSREVNARFLNAMADGSNASIAAMRLQHEALTRCCAGLEEAYGFFDIATTASATLHRHLEEVRASFRAIESHLNHEMAEIRTADGHAEQANRLIAEAEKAGNSAEPEASYRD